MNVLHSSMEITDQFYSNLNDKEIHDRISKLGDTSQPETLNPESIDALIEVLQSLRTARRGLTKGKQRTSQ